jgi:PAS domain S-box-containing protein
MTTVDDPRRHSISASETRSARERLFRDVIEFAPNGVVMVDDAGVILLVNGETERLFGYGRDELIGRQIDMLVPERFRSSHGAFRSQYFANPQRRSMGAGRDLFGLRKDGIEFPLEIGINPIDTDEGLFVIASIVDITSRRHAEERFRIAVEASPHGMVMVDPAGRITMVNRETERLFGYTREEMLGQPIEMLVPHQVRRQHSAERAAFVEHPQRRAMGVGRDLFGRRKDGSEIPVEIGLSPIQMDQATFVLASVVDISPRKRAEEELRRSNEELERFAYVASHDLQEPLRTVTSYMQLLSRRYRDQLTGDAVEFIDFAVAGAKRMQRLIQDLLAFSRVGTRGGALVAVDAGAIANAVAANLKAAIDEAHAQVTFEPLPRVMADPGQLEQLLTNLVANALKFRGADPPQVHVSARGEGRFIRISVRDNGIGIDSQFFDRIFVIFQRLHGREDYPGTGVGLAVCKKIVERHGGRIWVDSMPGAGATFHFTLIAAPE